MSPSPPKLILASGSSTRRHMLESAGVPIVAQSAKLDEEALQSEIAHLPAADQALALAREKARALSQEYDQALVIGADQILNCDGRIWHKAKNMAEAQTKLKALRGKTHSLHSAVACLKKGDVVFAHVAMAQLTMRAFSDDFLQHYLATHGAEMLSAVGCYHYEAGGIQLFEKIEGDHFTILGLPLLPLLAFLRQSAIIPT